MGVSLDSLLTFLLGVIVTTAGYFLKRWWESQPQRESLQETIQLVALHNDLRSGNVSLESLTDLKRQVVERSRSRRQSETAVIEKLEAALQQTRDYEPRTQRDMNQYSHHLAALAEQQVEFLVTEFRRRLNDDELRDFDEAQKAWVAYAHAHSKFESSEVAGGSMAPMVYSSALRVLMVQRAAELSQMINARNQIEIQ